MKIQHLIPILFLAAICTVSAQTNGILANTNTPAAVACAKDYHLKMTVLQDAPALLPVVYVLLLPCEDGSFTPLVYTTFDSLDMESDIRNLIGHRIDPGSVIRFDPSSTLKGPTVAQIHSIKDFCKKLGLTFVVGYDFDVDKNNPVIKKAEAKRINDSMIDWELHYKDGKLNETNATPNMGKY